MLKVLKIEVIIITGIMKGSSQNDVVEVLLGMKGMKGVKGMEGMEGMEVEADVDVDQKVLVVVRKKEPPTKKHNLNLFVGGAVNQMGTLQTRAVYQCQVHPTLERELVCFVRGNVPQVMFLNIFQFKIDGYQIY